MCRSSCIMSCIVTAHCVQVTADATPSPVAASDIRFGSPSAAPTTKLRIAFVGSNFDGVQDGVTLTLRLLARTLSQAGWEVAFFTLEYKEPTLPLTKQQDTYKIHRIPPRCVLSGGGYQVSTLGFSVSSKARAAWNEFKSFDPQVVHVYSPCALAWDAIFWARHQAVPVPVVSTFHTNFCSMLKYNLPGWLGPVRNVIAKAGWAYLRPFYNRCDRVLAPTHVMARELQQEGIKHAGVWPRGVDTSAFNPLPESEILASKPMVLYVGRLVNEKVAPLAAIANRLVEMNHDVVFEVAGDGPERARLEKEMPKGTKFYGNVDFEDLPVIYRRAMVLLFPSPTETFGRVNIEAMASGVPVIGINQGGSSEIIQHDISGYLVKRPQEVEEQARYASHILSDVAEWRRLRAGALERAQNYQWEQIMSQMMHTYVSCASTLGRNDR